MQKTILQLLEHSRKGGRQMRKGKGMLLIMLLVSCMGIGGTVAYLTAQTSEIINTMQPGMVPPHIEEDFDGTLKRNVRVSNNGNTAAFVRATVVVNWKDKSGNLSSDLPVPGQDYSITWSDSGWQKLGDYYYCTSAVEPQNVTPVFMEAVYQKVTKEGYDLVVDIMTQTIQARGIDSQGKTPVELAWNVVIENGEVFFADETEGGGK